MAIQTKHCVINNFMYGAGDGNRTHDNSLEGCGFTTKLHPHMIEFNIIHKTTLYKICSPVVPVPASSSLFIDVYASGQLAVKSEKLCSSLNYTRI